MIQHQDIIRNSKFIVNYSTVLTPDKVIQTNIIDLECELCYGIIEQAVVLLPCQHRKTCIQCAQLVMQDNRRCPFDRIKIDCLMIINN